jgi:hypothetical protein
MRVVKLLRFDCCNLLSCHLIIIHPCRGCQDILPLLYWQKAILEYLCSYRRVFYVNREKIPQSKYTYFFGRLLRYSPNHCDFLSKFYAFVSAD